MAAWEGGDVPGAGDELRPIVHPDRQAPAQVVLEVGRLAACRTGQRLHMVRPAPARLEGQAAKDEALIGTPDIQSLADLSNSFAVVREMRAVPFGRTIILQLALLTALPFTPLMLTMIPLEELIDRALAVFF